MSVGCICYATSRGLGHLAHDFYTHGVITDMMVVRHPSVPTNEDWYPNAPETGMRPYDVAAMQRFCDDKNAMLFFETPFHWPLIDYCGKRGIKTYLVTMYECTPQDHPPPYCYICPSDLDFKYFEQHRHVRIDLPVEYPWRLREYALDFVHNGGYLGMRGSDGVRREGTTTVIEAWVYFVKSSARLTVHVQENVPNQYVKLAHGDPRIQYVAESIDYARLYESGDVAIGAQKWNGCSLPLQEARASGMLVMNTNRYPMNVWLPTDPLIPVRSTVKHRFGGGLEFDESIINPRDVAQTVDDWYGRDVREYSLGGMEWAKTMSWAALRQRYLEVLSS